jgi:hypothetical protein
MGGYHDYMRGDSVGHIINQQNVGQGNQNQTKTKQKQNHNFMLLFLTFFKNSYMLYIYIMF